MCVCVRHGSSWAEKWTSVSPCEQCLAGPGTWRRSSRGRTRPRRGPDTAYLHGWLTVYGVPVCPCAFAASTSLAWHDVPSLLADGVPVCPYALAAFSSLAWHDVPSPVHTRCTLLPGSTPPPPWPDTAPPLHLNSRRRHSADTFCHSVGCGFVPETIGSCLHSVPRTCAS